MANESDDFSPPYNVPWATFLATIERIAADLPNKVDRSYLSSRSGSEQSYLISAFRGFGLINEDNVTQPDLRKLAEDSEDRPAMVADLLNRFYPKAMALGSSNSTPGELESAFADMFTTVTGASRIKAIRFFLAAAEYAGVPRSPLWKAPKASRSGGGGGARRVNRKKVEGAPVVHPPSTGSKGPNMKQAYFDLLLKKAESQDQVDTDLLDRIERLLAETED